MQGETHTLSATCTAFVTYHLISNAGTGIILLQIFIVNLKIYLGIINLGLN